MFTLPIIAAVIVIALYFVTTYNRFATIKTQIAASIQEIGNQLKRQASLIPNLESSAKGYLKHEKGIFKDLTNARKAVESAIESSSPAKLEKVEAQLNSLLPKLQVVVESNPEIKGAEVVTKLMDELRDTSDKLLYARRTLIDLSQDFNAMVVTFPSNTVAKLFGFSQEVGLKTPVSGEHIEVTASETKDPKVNL